MIGTYHSTFVLPVGAKKELGEEGWEFTSTNRLSRRVVDALINCLSLKESDSYLGIEEFVGSNMKMIVVLDSNNAIEHVCIRAYEGGGRDLEIDSALSLLSYPNVEIFKPQGQS